MIIRKLRKLKNNPKLFFKDMLEKRSFEKRSIFKSKKISHANFKYTIVSAVFGVEEYLNDFFISITSQTLDFENNINLIMVDDGSLDNSKDIILEWCQRYPKNIQYIYKKNGGQASARNMGLKLSEGDWISFIDPDDTVDVNYFLNVDKFAAEQNIEKTALISCNCIFNIQNKGLQNKHPLRHRFDNGNRFVKIKEMVNDFQLSASTAFFNLNLLKKSGIVSSTDIKPNFEDGHFVTRYLLKEQDKYIGFCKEAKYLYLKRQDSSSTLDGSLTDYRRYTVVLEKGYLDVLKIAKKMNGYIPLWLQNQILYELFWLIKYSLNNAQRLSFMTLENNNKFKELLLENFKYIDKKTILDFPLAGCWFYHKKGILKTLKNENTDFEITYLDKIDYYKKEVQLRYYSDKIDCVESIECNGVKTFPLIRKVINSDFLGEIFIYEHLITFNLSDCIGDIVVYVNGIKSRISIKGKQYRRSVPLDLIFSKDVQEKPKKSILELTKTIRKRAYKSKYKNAWLLMDRDIQADDNAEHLYNYISEKHPQINIFFVIRKSSHDWERLKKCGFKLIDFDSSAHKSALAWAEHLISSHADHYIVSKLNPKIRFSERPIRYTFLQHGVIKDDLSKWLNRKPFDLFITTTNAEYESIVGQGSPYKFSSKQVVKTGLARHDKLYEISKNSIRNYILIMPTWRNGIVGKATGQGNTRNINEDFFKTEYAIRWKNFLHSQELKDVSDEPNTEVIFFPHTNITPYIDGFDIPNHIKNMTHSPNVSIQEIFSKTKLLITDYSSVAFDLSYIEVPVLYYQFDREHVFSGDFHIYRNGYFNYENDGFGPVCLDDKKLKENLINYKNNDYSLEKIYLERIENTFGERNSDNCRKIFDAITSLNSDTSLNINEDYNLAMTEGARAEKYNYLELAKTRYISAANSAPFDNLKTDALLMAFRCAAKNGNIKYISENQRFLSKNINAKNTSLIFIMAFYERWNDLFKLLSDYNFSNENHDTFSLALRVSLENGKKAQGLFMRVANIIGVNKKLWKYYKEENWNKAASVLDAIKIENYFIVQLKLDLLMRQKLFDSVEESIDVLNYKLERWQFHRLYARLRASQGRLESAKWHYDRCMIEDKYELPLSDILWIHGFEKKEIASPSLNHSNFSDTFLNILHVNK